MPRKTQIIQLRHLELDIKSKHTKSLIRIRLRKIIIQTQVNTNSEKSKSPVFVCEVHPQHNVFLCVLVTTGVHHHHVANSLRPAAFQPHRLQGAESGQHIYPDESLQFCIFPKVLKGFQKECALTSLMRSSERRILNMICRCCGRSPGGVRERVIWVIDDRLEPAKMRPDKRWCRENTDRIHSRKSVSTSSSSSTRKCELCFFSTAGCLLRWEETCLQFLLIRVK